MSDYERDLAWTKEISLARLIVGVPFARSDIATDG